MSRDFGVSCPGGAHLRVDGHPEAKIVYWDAKGPNPAQTESRTGTTDYTPVSISQLVPAFEGELVTISGENTDGLPAGAGTCKLGQAALSPNDSWATGKIPLVANTITNVLRHSLKK